MGYYGGMGDYYGARGGRGDPFLGMLAPLAGGLIKRGVSAVAGRLGRGAALPAIAAASGLAGGTVFSPGGLPLPGGGRLRPGAFMPGGVPLIESGGCEPGYHKAKDGSGKCVRNRSMNVTNPKALRRAIRRQEGFVQLANRMGMVMRTRKVLKPKKARR